MLVSAYPAVRTKPPGAVTAAVFIIAQTRERTRCLPPGERLGSRGRRGDLGGQVSEREEPAAEPAGSRPPSRRHSVTDKITETVKGPRVARVWGEARGAAASGAGLSALGAVCTTAAGMIHGMDNMRLCVIDDGVYE